MVAELGKHRMAVAVAAVNGDYQTTPMVGILVVGSERVGEPGTLIEKGEPIVDSGSIIYHEERRSTVGKLRRVVV